MKDKINEHDMTKAMMSILRGGYKTKLLNEDINQEMQPDDDDQRDTISPKKGDAIFKDELKKLQDIVDPSVQIINFKIYPSGISFRMELKRRDIETTMNNVELDDNVSGVLSRLQGYYQNWCDEWAKKITNEFNQRQD
jgi:hypothetical protein